MAMNQPSPPPEDAMPAKEQGAAIATLAMAEARQPHESSTPSGMTFSDTVRQGDTAIMILDRAGVDASQAMALYRGVRHVYDLCRIHVGRAYHVQMDADGHIQQFTYEITHQQWLVVTRNSQGFSGKLDMIPFERRERLVVGELSESIYATLKAQGESSRLIHDLADIFAWSVDFATDLREGDPFRLLIEEHVRKGEPAEYHRILAAELINQNRQLQAVYYDDDDDDIGSYYRPNGSSVQGMFLRSPLRYTRISSRFSWHRFHPILKRYLPHLGVDYAAPTGTPVRSVADGTVVWAKRKGANGNMVIIRHHHAYKSYYLHLSRYAPGLRRNKRVAQGQIIGYVGSTGMATGPHLDFRLSKNGKYLNPLKHRSIEGPAVPKKAMAAFHKCADAMLHTLHQEQLALQQEAKSESPDKAE
jgi:murein DD-endopeptidase MepM/ murein hydrolase activator NlpD